MNYHWKPYLSYSNCFHIFCNAHHLKKLTFIYEQDNQGWTKKLINIFLEMKNKVNKLKESENTLSYDIQNKYNAEYDKIIDVGLEGNLPPPEIEKEKKEREEKTK